MSWPRWTVWTKWTTWTAGALALALTGCAGKKHSKAELGIPIPCIDRIVGGAEGAYCDTVEGAPDLAECHKIVVHFTCTKVKEKK